MGQAAYHGTDHKGRIGPQIARVLPGHRVFGRHRFTRRATRRSLLSNVSLLRNEHAPCR